MGIGPRILVTGATGNIGREVVAQLCADNFAVRALSRNPPSANLPDGVDVVPGDLTAPDTLDRALEDIDVVFLVWGAPLDPAADTIRRMASRVGCIVFLSAPIRTAHPFFQQPNALRSVHAATGGRRRSGTTISCAGFTAPQKPQPSTSGDPA